MQKGTFSLQKRNSLCKKGITLQRNANEMPVYFYMLSYYTINDVGAKSVTIKTSGNEKSN
jgi:hypothetical protein